MKKLIEQIKADYEVFAKDANAQVKSSNKAAGTRARKASKLQSREFLLYMVA